METFELGKMIVALRRELQQAQDDAVGQEIAFQVDDIELEVQLVAQREKGVKGSARFYVAELGADGKQVEGVTHRLKLRLKPLTEAGEELRVKGRRGR